MNPKQSKAKFGDCLKVNFEKGQGRRTLIKGDCIKAGDPSGTQYRGTVHSYIHSY